MIYLNIKHKFSFFIINTIVFILVFTILNTKAFSQDAEIPNFWDKSERFVRPDLSGIPRLKFLTTTDFPPFNFIDRKKRLSGFHVDLARAICNELALLSRCQIQALPWAELQDALEKGEGDAIIAGLQVTEETRKKFSFSRPYIHIPARFIVRKDSGLKSPAYEAIFKRKTGVVADSAHQAYFADVFSNRTAEVFPTRDSALIALKDAKIDAVFADALSLSFWLASNASQDCCMFLDGAFTSRKFFGNGLSIALPKDKPELVAGMDYALSRINRSEKFAELYLRYFPVGMY